MSNVEVKNKKTEFKKRLIASIVILSLIIPFIIFGAMPTNVFYSKGYDIFYAIVLTLVFGYAVFEIVNSVANFKEEKTSFLLIFIPLIFIPTTYGLFTITSAVNGSEPVANYLIFSLLAMIAMLLISSINDISMKKVLTSLGVTILLMLFFYSFIYASNTYYWNVILWILLSVATTDIAAYLGGKKYGKTHPFPNISPNKTTEGLIFGVSTGFAISMTWFLLMVSKYSVLPSASAYVIIDMSIGIFISLLICFMAPLGDLFFSKTKRFIGIKDFSNVIPGHGGLLDRIDSHIFTFTTAIFILILFIPIIF